MGKKKGKMVWVPAFVIEEIESIKKSENLFSRSEAFKKLASYSIKGRELKKVGYNSRIF